MDPRILDSQSLFNIIRRPLSDAALFIVVDAFLRFVFGSWASAIPVGLVMISSAMTLLTNPQIGLFRLGFVHIAWRRFFKLGSINIVIGLNMFTIGVLPPIYQLAAAVGTPEATVKSILNVAFQSAVHFAVGILVPYYVGDDDLVENGNKRPESMPDNGAPSNGSWIPDYLAFNPPDLGWSDVAGGLIGLIPIGLSVIACSAFYLFFIQNPWRIRQGLKRRVLGVIARRIVDARLFIQQIAIACRRISCSIATNKLNAYQYAPLGNGSIRILRLLPGTRLGCVRGILEPALLAGQDGSYEAMSHRWRKGKAIKIILSEKTKDNKLADYSLAISPAVYTLLRHMQPASGERRIWLDSVCIDQGSDTEKNVQIPLMRDVYQRASRVVCWLGDNASEAGGLTYFTTEFPAQPLAQWGKWWHNGWYNSRWYAALELLRNEWFCRVWIIQEVACARKLVLQHGRDTASWEAFIKAGSIVLTTPEIGTFLSEAGTLSSIKRGLEATKGGNRALGYLMMRDAFQGSEVDPKTVDLGKLLCFSIPYSSEQRKDRIHALVGMSSSTALDYQTPDIELFRKTAQDILTNSLEYIFLSGIGYYTAEEYQEEYQSQLPSWVPFWVNEYGKNHCIDGSAYKASGTRECNVATIGEDLLQVEGRLLDIITFLGEQWPTPENNNTLGDFGGPNQLDIFESLVQRERSAAYRLAPSSGRGVEEQLWRTRVIGFPTLEDSEEMNDLRARRLAWIRDLPRHARNLHRRQAEGGDISSQWVMEERARVERCFSDLSLGIAGRKMCFTGQGLMGVVPPYTRVGDRVCLFWGATTPTVVRAVTGTDRYTVIGACYIDGAMAGEFAGDDAPSETFTLQ